jgi:hypothetical protein
MVKMFYIRFRRDIKKEKLMKDIRWSYIPGLSEHEACPFCFGTMYQVREETDTPEIVFRECFQCKERYLGGSPKWMVG